MSAYALVSEAEDGDPIELPVEEDGSLLLSTVRAQFADACGLKFRVPGGRARGLRLADERLSPPPEGWAAYRYWCAVPRAPREAASDLIVLGLPWRTAEDVIREHFAPFGELLMVQVKRDPTTGLSKGFGFIRFAEAAAQERALGERHLIDGRWCDVRVPHGRGGTSGGRGKVFVGRVSESLSADDLRDYFSKFGRVTDVFVPRPHRAFSFVTFLEESVAKSLCGQDHIINGVSVSVSEASPRRRAPGSWGMVPGGRALWVGEGWPPPVYD